MPQLSTLLEWLWIHLVILLIYCIIIPPNYFVTGNVYISDSSNNRVRKVTVSTDIITTIAGTGASGYSGDGVQATSAAIKNPQGINLDSSGNVYFGDNTVYNVIRKITVSTGIISTVAGTGSTSGGYNGDNLQATSATLNNPLSVVLDSSGNLYISDRGNNRIRKVTVSTGMITTVVGTGTASSTGDGSAATSATINVPFYIRLDSSGNLYIAESDGNRVRKVIAVATDIPTAAPSVVPTTSIPRYLVLVLPNLYFSIVNCSSMSSAPPTTLPSYTPTSIPSVIPSATPSVIPSASPTTTPRYDINSLATSYYPH